MATFGICTGCHEIIKPGPHLTRRIKRHLSDWSRHNHDACRMYSMSRLTIRVASREQFERAHRKTIAKHRGLFRWLAVNQQGNPHLQ